ncbi:MAG: hypothetical protein Q7U48_13675 [Hydrogenophaga sp.]|nr:hypothetical protein [Hydrogenophaga sp.]
MSIPLQDIGSVKVGQATHSWLKAVSQVRGLDVTTVARQILDDHANKVLQEASLAQKIHSGKGFSEIAGERR